MVAFFELVGRGRIHGVDEGAQIQSTAAQELRGHLLHTAPDVSGGERPLGKAARVGNLEQARGRGLAGEQDLQNFMQDAVCLEGTFGDVV